MRKFEVVQLPWLLKLYRAAWRPAPRLRQQVLQMPLRWLFAALYKAGAGGEGRIRFGRREMTFDARNLQFGAVYMAEFSSEPDDVAAVLDGLLGSGKVFYDIGANWGYHSLLADAKGASVHAFEPMPGTARDLRRAVEGTRVTVHELALGETNGSARMSIPDGMHSGLATVGESGVEVRLARLDGLGLPPPHVIKLDVEGHELSVLKGMKSILELAKPVVVFESWEGEGTESVFGFLSGLGYKFSVPKWNGRSYDLVPIDAMQRRLLKAQVNVVATRA